MHDIQCLEATGRRSSEYRRTNRAEHAVTEVEARAVGLVTAARTVRQSNMPRSLCQRYNGKPRDSLHRSWKSRWLARKASVW